jgi:hypothetical protein
MRSSTVSSPNRRGEPSLDLWSAVRVPCWHPLPTLNWQTATNFFNFGFQQASVS